MSAVKRSRAVAIFGWLNVFAGSLGSIFFMMSIDYILKSLHYMNTHIPNVYTVGVNLQHLDAGILYCAMTFPYVIILFLGIGILYLSEFSRRIKVKLLLPFILVDGAFFIYVSYIILNKGVRWTSFLTLFVPLVFLSSCGVYFFSRSGVKEQFK